MSASCDASALLNVDSDASMLVFAFILVYHFIALHIPCSTTGIIDDSILYGEGLSYFVKN